MSESVKPRIAVDLSEIERHLAPVHAASSSGPSTRSDPLAELARIVGQEDPFQSMLAQNQRGRYPQAVPGQYPHAVQESYPHTVQEQYPHAVQDLDDLYRSADRPAQGASEPALRAGAGPQSHGYEHDVYGAAPGSHEPDHYADSAHAAYDERADYEDDYHPARDDQGSAYAEERDIRSLEPRRSRKGLLMGCAAAAVVVLAGAGWYASGPSTMLASGPPPVIKASADPTKVHPDNPGGVEIPNQNKQIYERAKPSTETKVVNREEQPIDVKEAARIAASASPAVTGTTGAVSPSGPGTSLNLGEPKKVRTVSIRPDGTVVTPDAAPAATPPARPAAMMPPPPMMMPSGAQPAPPTIQTAAAQPAPARPAASTPATPSAQKPVASAATPSAPPQRVASLQPVAAAEPAGEAAQAPVGGFSVQLGVRNSEGDAQKAFNQMQSKYADLQGQPALIRKAEVNGSTIYRVRVGPMSREDASTLCSRLQGGGAQCFVSKN